MLLAIVVGNVVAPIKTTSHENWKLLVVRPINLKQEFIGSSIIAIDVAKAGVGMTTGTQAGRKLLLSDLMTKAEKILYKMSSGLTLFE